MGITDFLQAVVPQGVIILAKRVPKDGYVSFSHTVYQSHSDADAGVKSLASSGPFDIYFALAAYQQGFHPNPAKPDKKQLRVRSNVAALKALWLDIDYKAGYSDSKQVVEALRAFCTQAAMPPPAILVGSGNGIHAYWPLTTAIGLNEWQGLADALKEAAKATGLKADLACTADACRILRPPGTTNWKDPASPKPVTILYSSGKTFEYTTLKDLLTPWAKAASRLKPAGPADPLFDEFTAGVTNRPYDPSRFEEVIKHCGVLKEAAETHGQVASEPEWTATLQLLRHCEDGALWVDAVSDQHPGYNAEATREKWEQRLANTAGPTLCSTFETYHSKACLACPHRGFIKTPLQLGVTTPAGESVAVAEYPPSWRVAPDGSCVERMMFDPATNQREWVKALRHIPKGLRVSRSIVTGKYELQFEIETKKSKTWTVVLPGGTLGNLRKLNEMMAEFGVVFKGNEVKNFVDFMATWLQRLQDARRVSDVTEQLGWLIEGENLTAAFSCGQTTFYADGRVRNDVRASREFSAISKYYEPKGLLQPWKDVAKFLTDQNNPAFVAILAAAFGAPLLKFTGQAGGILSIISMASGVGKSSALKCSQAVWGSPIHGINAVDDTPKSVARKIGYLNNLPAYWDELRGRKTVEDFLTLAFQITQGKERTRLDSSANLRDMQTWETMLVVAANESIFEAMAQGVTGSDAGVVRTYEMVIEPFEYAHNRAEVSLLFDRLGSNYGHAGRLYAQHIATHAPAVRQRIEEIYTRLSSAKNMQSQERFWFSIIAVLIVGAEIARDIGLCNIDQRSLMTYLLENLERLRGRSGEVLTMTSPSEVLAAFMQTFQDRALTVDRFPKGKQNGATYLPDITGGVPKADKIAYHVSRDEKLIRFPVAEFTRWLLHRNLPAYTIIKNLKNEITTREMRTKLGIGTRWELPPQRCLEVSIEAVGKSGRLLDKLLKEDDSLSPEDMTDSSSETPPAS